MYLIVSYIRLCLFVNSLHTLSHKISTKKNYKLGFHFVDQQIDSITQEIKSKLEFESQLDWFQTPNHYVSILPYTCEWIPTATKLLLVLLSLILDGRIRMVWLYVYFDQYVFSLTYHHGNRIATTCYGIAAFRHNP